jgi:tetraacyldisaccharide 4'-kinase
MDDGLQNPSLAKDLTLAIVDAARGLGNGEVIPAGPLRAPLDVQLGLTDAIVLNTPPNAADAAEGSGPAPPALLLEALRRDFPGPVIAASAEAATEAGALTGAPLVAFAGIANPARFFALLERLGGRIAAHLVFKDHHAYSESDAERLLALAVTHGATLVTTEKDHVRLVGYGGARERLAKAATALPIRLAFSEQDGHRLSELVTTAALTGGYRRGLR